MKSAPKTNFDGLISDINIEIANGRYADPDSFSLRKIKRDCEKVRSTQAAEGWGLLCSYYSVIGDSTEAERCFNASINLGAIPVVVDNFLASLCNHGLFSAGQRFFEQYGDPVNGQFSPLAINGLAAGAAQTFVKFYEKAQALNQELPQLPIETARIAASIFERAGITDERVALHLDAVGRVLRRNRLFIHDVPIVQATDQPGVFSGVTYMFMLKCTEEEAFDYNLELAVEEEEMGIVKNVAFDAIFLPL